MNKTKRESAQKLNEKEDRTERITLSAARDLLYEKFRVNLRLLRAKRGWSGCETGEKIGLKNGKRIIDLEYGRANPTMEEMVLISNFFQVPIDYLLNKEAQVTFI